MYIVKITNNTPLCKMVNFSRSVLKILHRAEKIYTGSARGARDKYEVWARYPLFEIFAHLLIATSTKSMINATKRTFVHIRPFCIFTFERQ